MGAVASVQVGAAIATTLFDELGPAGTVLLRTGFAAVVLVLLWRPSLRGRSRVALRDAVLFGLALAGMNLSFYAALDRIPLGIAVTFEFTGPFLVAVAGSRRASDLLWVALAAGGIVLLAPGIHGSLDVTGIAAGAPGGGVLGCLHRAGGAHRAGVQRRTGPVDRDGRCDRGAAAQRDRGGRERPRRSGSSRGGFAVAMLSSAIPYSLELEALRRLPKGTFGVLMSLEPGVAALVGLIALGQDLSANEVVAIGLVVAASAGALSAAGTPAPVEA